MKAVISLTPRKEIEMEGNRALPKRVKWSFGIANGILQMVYSVSGNYLSFFITDVCLLGAAMLSTISLISSLSTFVAVFIWSIIYQYSNTRFGRYRPWLLVCPIFIFVGYATIYTNWGLAPAIWSTIIIIGYALTTVGNSGVNVAMSSLMMKAGKTETERKDMVFIQNALHTAVRVISAAAVLPIILAVGGSRNAPEGYFAYFAGFSFLTVFGYLFVNIVTKPYDKYEPNFKASGNRVTPGDLVKTLAANRQLLIFFVSEVVLQLLYLCKTLGFVYFITYICGNFTMYAAYTTLSPFCGLLGTFLAAYWCKKSDKIEMSIICFIIQAATYVFLAAIAFATGTINTTLFIAVILLGDLVNGTQRAVLPVFYMDMAEDSYNKTGKDITPIVMALKGIPFSFGFIASGSIVGAVLAATGYVANAVQTAAASRGIIFAVIVIPIFGLLQFIIMLRKGYKLDQNEVTRIYAENAAKREALNDEAQ